MTVWQIMKVFFGFFCFPVLGSSLIFGKVNPRTSGDIQCPKECSCANNAASCNNSNLNYIPALPNNILSLNFSENDLGYINKSTFSNIPNLRIEKLILSSCKIKCISKDAFSSLSDIKSLDLSKNKLTYSTLKCGLVSLNDSKLKSLKLDSLGNRERELPNDLFESLSKTHLRHLSLADNDIETINGKMFSPLPVVEYLNLYGNFIRRITFVEMRSLVVLDLGRNDLSRVPSFSHKQNKSLCYLPRLKKLNLECNHISDLGDGLDVQCMQNLKYLSAKFNPIGVINNEQFLHFKSLKTVDLNYMLVRRLRLRGRSFSSHTLEHLRIGVLKHDMNKHQLKIFENCTTLVSLDIIGFRLWRLEDYQLSRLFEPVLKLKKLRIKSAALREIPSIISKMERLVNLTLFNNYLSHWKKDAFQDLRQLKYLDLTNNEISVINRTSFPDHIINNLVLLRLSYNPFACTCDNYWFIQWTKGNDEKLGSDFPEKYTCFSPTWLNYRPITLYNPTLIECNGLELYQKAILAAGVVIVIIVMTCIIYKRYIWHFRYYLYLIRSKKEKGTNSLLAYDTFKYDAFVAYTSEDRSWVISNLMAVLEGEHNFSLCLHERDFLPGRTILDQISETIKHSRKVILVLSTNFAKSLWCQYEILLAQNKLMEDGVNALILIVLDEVKEKYMTNCLCLLLRTLTYIKWTTNNEGRKLFWKKVVLSLKA